MSGFDVHSPRPRTWNSFCCGRIFVHGVHSKKKAVDEAADGKNHIKPEYLTTVHSVHRFILYSTSIIL